MRRTYALVLFTTGYATLWALPLVVATVPVMLVCAAAGILLVSGDGPGRRSEKAEHTAGSARAGVRPRPRACRAGAKRRARPAARRRAANPRGREGR